MTIQNPGLQTRPNFTAEEAKEFGRKGGLVKSPSKSLAATLRNLERSKQLKPEMREWLMDMMYDNEKSSYHILKYIANTMPLAKTVKDRKEMAKLLLDFKKQRHGTEETKHELSVTKIEQVTIKFEMPQELQAIAAPVTPVIEAKVVMPEE